MRRYMARFLDVNGMARGWNGPVGRFLMAEKPAFRMVSRRRLIVPLLDSSLSFAAGRHAGRGAHAAAPRF